MTKMYKHSPGRLELRRKFEQRRWKSTETFLDYIHDTLILTHIISMDKKELIDYAINRINGRHLCNQTNMQQYRNVASLLEAFCSVPLGTDGDVTKRRTANTEKRHEIKSSPRKELKKTDCTLEL
ncbi:hypothetical protein KM043_017658 [Ampulex compressa]|nr:hypothetical protein KM043_017658 [Ampulex compressa]